MRQNPGETEPEALHHFDPPGCDKAAKAPQANGADAVALFPYMKVLVVDDEAEYRILVQQFLLNLGHFCESAASTVEALEKISRGSYDLVISDIKMGSRDGLELMHEAKASSPDLEFILMTGFTSIYTYSDIINNGAYDYLAKPFELGELQAKMRRLQREKALLNRLKQANEALHRKVEVNSTIARLSTQLMEMESLDGIASLVFETAKLLTGSPLGCIGYYEASTGKLIYPVKPASSILLEGDGDLSQTLDDLTQWTLRHGQPLLANGIVDADSFGLSDTGFVPLDRFLSAPAIANGIVLGQIVLANSSREYTEQDLLLVESLAAIYALAAQRLQAALNLRRTNDYMENIFENSPDAIAITDRNGNFLKWNRMAVELYGFTLAELKGKSAFDLYADRNELNSMKRKLRAEGAVRKHEMQMKKKDGSIATFEISISRLTDPLTGPIGTVCVARDLSPLKKMIEELRRTYTELSQLLVSIPSFLIGLSPDGRITRWNAAAEKIFGITKESARGAVFKDCEILWDWSKVTRAIALCRQKGAATQLEGFDFKRPNGKKGFLDVMINSVATTEGSFGILLLGSDVTERKILESQLVQAQKLESIGQLAAGIAHEINTPAQYVGDNIRFLQEAFRDLQKFQSHFDSLLGAARSGHVSEDIISTVESEAEAADLEYLREEIPKAVQQSLEGIDRISKIVRAMKEFSHPGTDVKTDLDLNRAIESTITVARNEWKYVADLATDFDPNLPLVPCLPGEFNQVVLNMIINAAHAIAQKLGKDPLEKGRITVGTRLGPGEAEIRISDNGTGIPKEIMSRIFDPFFTTKEVGKGTGQGLAISHSVIIDKHGGAINVESEVGKGTTFTIKLPLTAKKEPKELDEKANSVR